MKLLLSIIIALLLAAGLFYLGGWKLYWSFGSSIGPVWVAGETYGSRSACEQIGFTRNLLDDRMDQTLCIPAWVPREWFRL